MAGIHLKIVTPDAMVYEGDVDSVVVRTVEGEVCILPRHIDYLAALGTALPYTIAYAASNVIFLNLLARPFGEKLERVRIKYGC